MSHSASVVTPVNTTSSSHVSPIELTSVPVSAPPPAAVDCFGRKQIINERLGSKDKGAEKELANPTADELKIFNAVSLCLCL